MHVGGLFHYTLLCDESPLQGVEELYERAIGFVPGTRPQLRIPALVARCRRAATRASLCIRRVSAGDKRALDHIAFRRGPGGRAAGFVETDIEFTEAPVPAWPLHQVFIYDPTGLRIELTFELKVDTA